MQLLFLAISLFDVEIPLTTLNTNSSKTDFVYFKSQFKDLIGKVNDVIERKEHLTESLFEYIGNTRDSVNARIQKLKWQTPDNTFEGNSYVDNWLKIYGLLEQLISCYDEKNPKSLDPIFYELTLLISELQK